MNEQYVRQWSDDEIRQWCHDEMRALKGSVIYNRAQSILLLVSRASAPPWLGDAAEALGEVRPDDGAPLALNWTQVIQAIRELREDRDTLLKISAVVNGALNGESPLDREQRATKALYAVASYGETKAECAAEKKLAAIAMLVSIYDRQDEPEGQVSARRALTAIGETIGQPCSICRSRHGSEVQHACE